MTKEDTIHLYKLVQEANEVAKGWFPDRTVVTEKCEGVCDLETCPPECGGSMMDTSYGTSDTIEIEGFWEGEK